MRFSLGLLALPASLLQLLANGEPAPALPDDSSPIPWPYNLPRDAKVWPEDPPNRRRDVEAVKHLIREGAQPVAVKKMSGEPDEKFFPEYWGFSDQDMEQAILGLGSSWALRQEYHEEDDEVYSNGSTSLSFRPAFPLHTEDDQSVSRRDIMDRAKGWLQRRDSEATLAILKKRGFECIAGTSPCTAINQPNLCCGTGETCYTIPDTGLGTVGCCPSGQNCGGSISCTNGNTPCFVQNTGGYVGGGCCIPGFVCAGVGCIASVSVITSTQTTAISASPTVVIVTETISPTVTPSTSTFTTTDTAIQTTTVCPASYTACPVNLGGGCCPSGQSCRVGSCPSATTQTTTTSSTATSTSAGNGPVRGTTVTSSSLTTNSVCPTGFYACSATYRGGCCQTGQDCQTTNCPAQASTTIVSSGLTIVVPLTPSATTTAVGHCAAGWSSCAATLGGACCPTNWACGTVSCFSSTGPSQSASQPKEGVVLGGAGRASGGVSLLAVMAGLGFALVIL